MATETLSLTELRPRLSEIVERAHQLFDRFVITRRGRVEAVLLSAEDYEGLLETLEILGDEELVQRLISASPSKDLSRVGVPTVLEPCGSSTAMKPID